MCLCDLSNSGDYNLIIADVFSQQKAKARKIKVFKGTNQVSEMQVEDKPVAMVTIFDTLTKPNLPVIAVAVGRSIVYFKDF
jgi:hypothetical protein